MIPFNYKKCIQCQTYKIIIEFRYTVKNGYSWYTHKCKKCLNENRRNNLQLKEKEKLRKSTAKYKAKSSKYYKLYSSTERFKKHRSERRKQNKNNKTSSIEKLKKNVSSSVLKFLKCKNSSKENKSVWKFLSYSPKELKNHLEKLFESWMTWDNQGVYNPTIWDDNNPTTWKWQLDHIIPHSTFNYDSMEHPDFQKCWALSNLRPLKAKENVMDGAKKLRHINE